MLSIEDKKDIEEIFSMCIEQLKKNHLLKKTNNAIYDEISDKLFEYYRKGANDRKITAAINDFKDDTYINIIPLFFKNRYTIENIADMMNVDVSTIVRNKKRLCLNLYMMLD